MNKIYNGIMGLVVGDALGVPVEFKERDSYEVTDMMGFGTYNQKPGTWSDDSSMTLATLESMGRLGSFDAADIMNNFYQWLQNDKFTPWGKVFDVGGATRRAIVRYSNGTDPVKCGGKTRMDNGNGALMRILPVAMLVETDPHDKMVTVKSIAGLTHNHPISHIACFIYAFIVENLMNNVDKPFPMQFRLWAGFMVKLKCGRNSASLLKLISLTVTKSKVPAMWWTHWKLLFGVS